MLRNLSLLKPIVFLAGGGLFTRFQSGGPKPLVFGGVSPPGGCIPPSILVLTKYEWNHATPYFIQMNTYMYLCDVAHPIVQAWSTVNVRINPLNTTPSSIDVLYTIELLQEGNSTLKYR